MKVNLTKAEMALLSTVIHEYLIGVNKMEEVTKEGQERLAELEIAFGSFAFPKLKKYMTKEVTKERATKYYL